MEGASCEAAGRRARKEFDNNRTYRHRSVILSASERSHPCRSGNHYQVN